MTDNRHVAVAGATRPQVVKMSTMGFTGQLTKLDRRFGDQKT